MIALPRTGLPRLATTMALVVAIAATVTVTVGAAGPGREPQQASKAPGAAGAERRAGTDLAVSAMPLWFEANAGQAPPDVSYLARGGGYEARFDRAGVVLGLADHAGQTAEVRLRMLGSSAGSLEGVDAQEAKANYLVGSDRSNWRTGVPIYRRVAYRQVYPGIDAVFYGAGQDLEYDFVVAPGADPGVIALNFDGAGKPRLEDSGDLVIDTAAGPLRQRRPLSYQEGPGGRQRVEASYTMGGDGTVGLRLGIYDSRRELVIDPVVEASTYVGSGGRDRPEKMAVGPDGAVYLALKVYYNTFPTTGGSYRPVGSSRGGSPVVVKLSADLKTLVYATYLTPGRGFNDEHWTTDIVVDETGSAYVSGQTGSTGTSPKAMLFPTTPNAVFDCGNSLSTPNHITQAFLTKFTPDGSDLAYSTCLGVAPTNTSEFSESRAHTLALAGDGKVWVGGYTDSAKFPVTANALQPSFAGITDGFLAQIDTTATQSLAYSTYLGTAEGFDSIGGVGLDGAGNLYVSGGGSRADLVTGLPCSPSEMGPTDSAAFSAKFVVEDGGLRRVWSGCQPGGKVDAAGNTVGLIGAFAFNPSRFVTAGAYRSIPVDGDTLFFKRDPDGNLVYGTYLGVPWGGGLDVGNGLAVDGERVYVVASASGPVATKNAPAQESLAGATDMYVGGFDTSRSGEDSLVFATYMGGSDRDGGFDVALGTEGDLYVMGVTQSIDLFTPASGFQADHGGGGNEDSAGQDTFVARLIPPPRLTSMSASGGPACGGATIRLGGTRLAGTTKVEFGAVAAAGFSVVDDSTLDVVVPPHPPGTVPLTATGPPGSASLNYEYQPVSAPVVASVTPNSGPVEGGSPVAITGTGLGCVRTARFGSNPATSVRVVSDAEIRITSPPGLRGPVGITLGYDTGDGSLADSVPSPTLRFNYLAIPILSSVLPACGVTGTQVLIQGSHLSGTTKVAFGPSPAPTVVAVPRSPDTQLAVVAPTLGEGEHNVVVTTVDGSSAITSQATFRVPCGSVVPETPIDDPGAGGGTGNESTTQNPVVPPGGTGGTPGSGFVTNTAPGGSPGTATGGLGGTPPGAGLAGLPVGAGLPSASASASASSASTSASVSAQVSSVVPSASPTPVATANAQAAGLVAPAATPTPSPAGVPNPEPAEPATRYAMVADSENQALAYGIGAYLLLLLGLLSCTILNHTRRPRLDVAPAWAHASR